jgi:hypothetical protein
MPIEGRHKFIYVSCDEGLKNGDVPLFLFAEK